MFHCHTRVIAGSSSAEQTHDFLHEFMHTQHIPEIRLSLPFRLESIFPLSDSDSLQVCPLIYSSSHDTSQRKRLRQENDVLDSERSAATSREARKRSRNGPECLLQISYLVCSDVPCSLLRSDSYHLNPRIEKPGPASARDLRCRAGCCGDMISVCSLLTTFAGTVV